MDIETALQYLRKDKISFKFKDRPIVLNNPEFAKQ